MKDIYYPSANGINTVHASIFECENPKFVLQVVHGMQEHILRYENFAKFLNENGIIMAGEDHLGHGQTTQNLGNFGEGDTVLYVIEDVHKLNEILKRKYNLPVYIMGHSMGSFITRYYISKYKTKKAIIMGTGNVPKTTAKLLYTLASIQEKLYGTEHRSKLLTNLTTGAYSKKTKKGHWISYNEENIKNYMSDSLCNFKFAPSGFKFLGKILELIQEDSTFSNAKDTKLLFVSGVDDLVGANDGVRKVHERYLDCGADSQMKLFENMRHEILNERENKKVYETILNFLEN